MRPNASISAVLGTGALLFAGLTGPTQAATADPVVVPPRGVILEAPAHGKEAINKLGAKIAKAAARNDVSVADLKHLLRTDPMAWVDTRGMIFYIDELTTSGPATVAEAAPFPYDQTFSLHSRPGSTKKVFLDFDGHTVSGTAWNDEGFVGTSPQPAFDLNSSPTSFSDAERDVIQSVWQRVSEDFAPFDVDVTTEDPGAAGLRRTSTSDTSYGMRALITPSDSAAEAICSSQCGGVAYVGVYDLPEIAADTTSYYQPAWIFPQQLGNDAKSIAEAASHEVGHTLGLDHDATSTANYYAGHGAWAPIMGVGYSRPISQWSMGEYADAVTSSYQDGPDDLAVITEHGLDRRPDDHADTKGGATAFGGGTTLTGSGTIGARTDKDYFSITRTCEGPLSVDATPAPTSPNLDISLKLFDAVGTELAAADPLSGSSNRDTATGLDASASLSVPAGTFYIEIDGVGARNPATTGYSDYGSLGGYTLTADGCGDGEETLATAPTDVNATAGDGQATITWAPPSDSGTYPVDSYQVTTLRGTLVQSTNLLPATARTLVKTGLTNGEAYSFQVRSITAAGAGASAQSPVVTPKGAPGTPGIGRAKPGAVGGKITATAVWTAPTSTGGSPITGYTVRALRMSRSGAVLSQTVSGLRPASGRSFAMGLPRKGQYRFTVQAVNSVGASVASSRSNKVAGR